MKKLAFILFIILCICPFSMAKSINLNIVGPDTLLMGNSAVYEVIYSDLGGGTVASIQFHMNGEYIPTISSPAYRNKATITAPAYTGIMNIKVYVIIAQSPIIGQITRVVEKNVVITNHLNMRLEGPDTLSVGSSGVYGVNYGNCEAQIIPPVYHANDKLIPTMPFPPYRNKAIIDAPSAAGIMKVKAYVRIIYSSLREETIFFEKNVTIVDYSQLSFTISAESCLACQGENVTYTINEDLPAGAQITWSSVDNNLLLSSGQGTRTATFQTVRALSGYTSVKASVSIAGKTVEVTDNSVWLGKPDVPRIVGLFDALCGWGPNKTYLFNINTPLSGFATSVDWQYEGNISLASSSLPTSNSIMMKTGSSGSFILTAALINRCGIGSRLTPLDGYPISQNPATYIDCNPILDQTKSSLSLDIEDSRCVLIEIYDIKTSRLVLKEKNPEYFNIQNTLLNNGIYIIRKTFDNGKIQSEKALKTNR